MTKRGVVLEFILGGGLQGLAADSFSPSFRAEGWGMLSQITSDWQNSNVGGEKWEIIAPLDSRAQEWFPESRNYPQFRPLSPAEDFVKTWCRLAADADAVILIAPESDNHLERLCLAIDEVTDQRIGCRDPFLHRAANKLLTAQHLSDEFLHPQTFTKEQFCHLNPSSSNRWSHTQWVMKPCDGAGCDGIYRGDLKSLQQLLCHSNSMGNCLVQHYLPGKPASVSAWVSHSDRWWMPPVWQDLQWHDERVGEGTLASRPRYHGGSGPIPKQYWSEIHRFGDRVLDLMGPGAAGWIGIDFVFNPEAKNQTLCTAIEVNPRWTTSYLGLRQMFSGNLLEACLQRSLAHGASDTTAHKENKWSQEIVSWSV